jgi:hypothetical protein
MINNFIRLKYFIFTGFVILVSISGCSISKKTYTEDFGYSTTNYRVSRAMDTIIKPQPGNETKIQGKILEEHTNQPFYNFRKISFKNVADNILYAAAPDLDGAYAILVEQGTYTISFEPGTGNKNYNIIQKDSITFLRSGETRVLNFTITEDKIEADGTRVYKNRKAYKKAQRAQ